MRLERIIRILRNNLRYILLSAVVAGILGILVFYFFPFKFNATGSLFVSRRPDLIQREEFTYEGYYAQRSASDYANTVIGMLESQNLKKRVLEKQGIKVNEQNLRQLEKNIDVRKKAPQLVFIKVKAESKQEAGTLWNIIAEEVINLSSSLNRIEGDPNLSIQKLGDPVTTQTYKEILIFSFVGFLVGAFCSIIIIFGKSQIL